MSATLQLRARVGQRSAHMIICGDDGLAHRLAQELDAVCGEAVTVVLPSRREGHGAEVVALHQDPHSPVELLISARPDEQTLRKAGVERAAALALTYGDDQINMTAALLARSINPSVRLVIRMFNRDRGRHLELLLDRAATAHAGHDDAFIDASTTVLSDADTAVPELVAAAAVGHGPTLQVEGKVFRGVVRPAGTPPHATDLATLAVLSGTHMDDPMGEDSAETPGANGTQLLPDTATAYHRQFTHGRLMLEEVTHHHAPTPPVVGDIAQRGVDALAYQWQLDEQARIDAGVQDQNAKTFTHRENQLRALSEEWAKANPGHPYTPRTLEQEINTSAVTGNVAAKGLAGTQ